MKASSTKTKVDIFRGFDLQDTLRSVKLMHDWLTNTLNRNCTWLWKNFFMPFESEEWKSEETVAIRNKLKKRGRYTFDFL